MFSTSLRIFVRYGMQIFLLVLINACHPKQDRLLIATAANMQFAIEELISSFTEQTGIECEAVVSSSGKLMAQIKEGAPFHVFISADLKYPEELSSKGLTIGEPEIYAYGKLVLWSVKDGVEPSISLLSDDFVRHIAIANPKSAPYGRAAIEVLEHYDIYEDVETKLVFGESIAQTNQFITSGAAEIGFTSKSVVLSSTGLSTGTWVEIDPNVYSPIAQSVVIIKNQAGELVSAKKFHEFLFSEGGKKILDKFGYSVN